MMSSRNRERIVCRTLAKGRPMASATASRSTLSDAELQGLLGLIKDVDSVELKLTVPEPAQLSTARALGLDPLQAQIRQVFFFDTPDLTLDGHGLVVRARRSQKKGDDTVVKLRPIVPAELPAELRQAPDQAGGGAAAAPRRKATTPSSSYGRSSQPSYRTSYGSRRTSASSSTP